MADLISETDLQDLPGITSTPAQRTYAARRASNLVSSHWAKPVDPVPPWVKDIAIDVAARYLSNPRGLASTTRTVDEASRTERFETGTGSRPRRGFFLEEDELRRLAPKIRRRVGSVRLGVPRVDRDCS